MKASLFILLLIMLLNYEANSVPTRFPPRTSRPTQPPTAGSTTTTRGSTTRLITTHSTTKGPTTTESTTTSSTKKPQQTTSTIIHLKPTETEKTSPTIQSTVSPNKLTTKLTNLVIKKTNSVEDDLNNTMECGPGTYKCHGVQSHCIMITQICDAKQDCPFGDDESISCLPITNPIQSSPIDLQRSNTNYISGTGFMFNVGNIIMTGNAKVRMFNQNSDNIGLPNGGVVNVNSD